MLSRLQQQDNLLEGHHGPEDTESKKHLEEGHTPLELVGAVV